MAIQVNAQTEDGVVVAIPQELIPQLTLISNTLALSSSTSQTNPFVIPLPKVSSSTLNKVLEYAKLHLQDPAVHSPQLVAAGSVERREEPERSGIKLNLSGPRARSTENADEDDDDVDDDSDTKDSGSMEDTSVSDDDGSASAYLLEELTDPITPADRKFTQSLDLPSLIEMTSAANYLAMEPLLDLCCKTIAGHMTGLSTEELRAKFGIVNDFTPEEEARMRAEFGWADE